MSKKTLFTLVLFLLLLIAGFLGWRFWPRSDRPALGPDEEVLAKARQALDETGFRLYTAETGGMWWGKEGERFLYDTFAPGLVVEIGIPAAEIKLYVNSQTNRIYEYPKLTQVYDALDRFFKENGFSQNSYNSVPAKTGLEWSDYIAAYERGSIKCNVSASNEVSATTETTTVEEEEELVEEISKIYNILITTSCENDFSQAQEEQEEFIRDLGLTGNEVGVIVVKRFGNFLSLAVVYRNSETAASVIAQENGQLVKLYDSQEVQDRPTCAQMQKYQVPQEIYGVCR